ncbi:MAG: hypothetical protein IAE92_03750 [Burkholderiaceae bacterium]|nr:hypothetical protein [Burkholderiaceae bacterium]
MGPLDLINHLLNFVAPALAVGGGVALFSQFFMKNSSKASAIWSVVAINIVVGVAVLVAGLLWFGRDGKMATYLALVVAVATAQWIQLGSWRR